MAAGTGRHRRPRRHAHPGARPWAEVRVTAPDKGPARFRATASGTWAHEGATLRLRKPLLSSGEAAEARFTLAPGGDGFATPADEVTRAVQRYVRTL